MRILVVNRHPAEHLGGSEIQSERIAAILASRGHDVTYAAVGSGDPAPIGERTYRVEPVRELRFSTVAEVIARCQPDIIYWRAGRRHLLATAWFCRIRGIRTVVSISSNDDLDPWATRVPKPGPERSLGARLKLFGVRLLERMWNRIAFLGLHCVDGMVVLSHELAKIAGVIIRRGVQIRTVYDSVEVAGGSFDHPRPYVVWVSNLSPRKRPEAYVDLASRLSDLDVDFIMVGAVRHPDYRFLEMGESLPSRLRYLGPRPLEETDAIIGGAALLVHTCRPEGFGNNFIQAWLQGIPTLTLEFDPDGIIDRERLGTRAGTLELLESEVRSWLADPDRRRGAGERARTFAERHFNPERNVSAIEELFRQLLEGAPSR